MGQKYQDRRKSKGLEESKSTKEREKEEENGEEKEEKDKGSALLGFGRDLLIDMIVAASIMAIILLVLWLVTGHWPPLVVIESKSMHHQSDSELGVIDMGDLVLVKDIERRTQVKSWVEGKEEGYKTYNDYGNVIIYYKNGHKDETPVIHRAIVWVDFNDTGRNVDAYRRSGDASHLGSWDIPTMGLYGQKGTIWIPDFKFYIQGSGSSLPIDLNEILKGFDERDEEPHGGFLTKGDANGGIDQESLRDGRGQLVAPIKVNWIVGRAMGEIPWYGIIKLTYSDFDSFDESPQSSKVGLFISIVVILVILILLETMMPKVVKVVKKKIKEVRSGPEEEEQEEEEKPARRGRRGKEKEDPPPEKKGFRGRKAKEEPVEDKKPARGRKRSEPSTRSGRRTSKMGKV